MPKDGQTTFGARIWKPDAVFVAVRRFDYGARTFEQGDVFPWRDLGLVIHQVRTLWSSVLLNCVEPTKIDPPVRKTKRAAQPEA
jgi:hypothetical protein